MTPATVSITPKPSDLSGIDRPHVFFTGKGGVGKTTIACAVALGLADRGRRVLLVSTDPASNLGDVLHVEAHEEPRPVPGVANLWVANLDPEEAAASYRRRMIEPYRGVVPEDDMRALEEQLSGQCTVEVAAFDEFTRLLVAPPEPGFDNIIFDTAPTGHALRLLSLPGAWSSYLEDSPAGASCLGPLSGLEAQRAQYRSAVNTLADPRQTLVVLVSRPESGPLREAARAASELGELGIANLELVVNGVLTEPLAGDELAQGFARRQRHALGALPPALDALRRTTVPLRAADLVGVEALRAIARGVDPAAGPRTDGVPPPDIAGLDVLIDELATGSRGAILVMGKGGVGKSTIAAAIALGLSHRGLTVELTSTDPAGHWQDILGAMTPAGLSVSNIDPAAEVAAYVAERLEAAHDLNDERRALLEEDLRSPCTEELAVFRAFSRTLARARGHFVVLDTAPTGHTLLLLDTTGAYHRDTMHGAAERSVRMTTPLMRLQDREFTRVIIVTLPESTPVQEAERLQADLRRAGIEPFGWVINASMSATGTRDPVLASRALLEAAHIGRVGEVANRVWVVPWKAEARTAG
jgi:arsenite/tail-anchored protein-transporting ATPase